VIFRTRFAPSPTGPLHLGHAYSAVLAHDMAIAAAGEFLLRIEDIDQSRARASWEAQIYDDLAWLGLSWSTPVMRQSCRKANYDAALDDLWARGLLYVCTCSRADIAAAMSAPQEGVPTFGPDGMIYPGTCCDTVQNGPRPKNATLRLNMSKAVEGLATIQFTETGTLAGGILTPADTLISTVGDIVLARRDMGTSYHLSVVIDDAAQQISHVVRGEDLLEATQIHVVLQHLLNLPKPIYHHHALVRDGHGKRLAKRDDARAISLYRSEGYSAQYIKNLCGIPDL
jgi:glutamyl-Q tRNA(Asp) synthetase